MVVAARRNVVTMVESRSREFFAGLRERGFDHVAPSIFPIPDGANRVVTLGRQSDSYSLFALGEMPAQRWRTSLDLPRPKPRLSSDIQLDVSVILQISGSRRLTMLESAFTRKYHSTSTDEQLFKYTAHLAEPTDVDLLLIGAHTMALEIAKLQSGRLDPAFGKTFQEGIGAIEYLDGVAALTSGKEGNPHTPGVQGFLSGLLTALNDYVSAAGRTLREYKPLTDAMNAVADKEKS